jgi:hypothetical protein
MPGALWTGFRPWALAALLAGALAAPAAAGADKDHDQGPRDDDRPTEKMGLRSRMFPLKHRSPEELMRLLRPLASGIKGTTMADSAELKIITVRDFPENVAAIDATIKRLDVERPSRPDVELDIRVLIAGPAGAGQYPHDLDPVVKELQATLSYQSYYQVASLTHRVRAGAGAKGKGVTAINPPVSAEATALNYTYSFEEVALAAPSGQGQAVVQIKRLSYWTGGKALGEAEISTGLTLREGQKVVVGTAGLKDRAMILVLFARLAR